MSRLAREESIAHEFIQDVISSGVDIEVDGEYLTFGGNMSFDLLCKMSEINPTILTNVFLNYM